jgi:hypothetical protein
MAYSLKQKLINDIQDLPEKKIKEVFDFVEYLKLKEDEWFIRYVNQRGREAGEDRKAGKKFISLAELQKEYR